MMTPLDRAERGVSLRPYCTLRTGGPAERLVRTYDVETLAQVALQAQSEGVPTTYLGWGSNVLPSDDGVPGLVVVNLSSRILVDAETGEIEADSGCGFQDLFLKSAQAGLRGLEYAVGIPGSLGGALVSNAGAYRSQVSEFLTEIEIVQDGVRRWVEPSMMEFRYRDSILRRPSPPAIALLRVRMRLPKGSWKSVYDEAREYQRQRIGKQPPPASAGSFFKNVVDRDLAARTPHLTPGMRAAGVVPAGMLIEMVGLKGFRHGGAMFSPRHANFILNVRGATATEIRELADLAKAKVLRHVGARLEEEVLYLGDWSRYRPAA
ncbi:MAG: UDP-N-acetylmuramate dehydrogenase [Fimbriimonadaceae bacterium]